MNSKLPDLSLLETRVLDELVEKPRTVRDTYPLAPNSLVTDCSQKTSRDPVMSVKEVEVQATVDRLRLLSLVVESSGERVMRYAHNIERVLDVPSRPSRCWRRSCCAAANSRRTPDQQRSAARVCRRLGGRAVPARARGPRRGRARRRVAAPTRRARESMGAPAFGCSGDRDNTRGRTGASRRQCRRTGRARCVERVRTPPRRRARCAQAPGRDAARRTRQRGVDDCTPAAGACRCERSMG